MRLKKENVFWDEIEKYLISFVLIVSTIFPCI